MNKQTARRQWSALIVLLAGLVLVGSIAAVAAFSGDTGTPTPTSTAKPSPAPVVTPVPSGTPIVTPEPSDEPSSEPEPSEPPVDAMPLNVILDTLGTGDVSVDIVDDTFGVVDAVTGTPSGGVSVPQYTLQVENIDATTLRLTWSDRPGDVSIGLFIDRSAGRFVMVVPEHDLDGDAIILDRELILTFREPIDAGAIETFVQDGLDTPG
ncbi:MAG TPA: hypothetical protein VI076_06460 [Actinopolymorphaceae bacterium]